MLTLLGGVFFPTGHTMIMYPTQQQAEDVARRLVDEGFAGDVYLVPAHDILGKIAPTLSDADEPLPSAGTEGATAREFVELARDGHAGLLVQTPDAEGAEKLMASLGHSGYVIARRYGQLVIEDL
jgi:hypothetical protein